MLDDGIGRHRGCVDDVADLGGPCRRETEKPFDDGCEAVRRITRCRRDLGYTYCSVFVIYQRCICEGATNVDTEPETAHLAP